VENGILPKAAKGFDGAYRVAFCLDGYFRTTERYPACGGRLAEPVCG
jgi:hypothetical protein